MRNFFGRRVALPVWALILIALVAIGIGGAGAQSSPEDTSQDTLALEARAVEAENEATRAVSEARAELEKEYAEREASIKAQSATLDQREAAIKAVEVAKKANVIEGDGIYEVGVDIQPGTWKTQGSGQSCYWQTSSKGGDILANGNVDGPAVVVIPASAFSFTSTRCGKWTKTG